MCGIVAVCELRSGQASDALVKRMADAIAHRGPDDEGVYVDGPAGLAHRRLAIIDLSPLGHQPMEVAAGRLVITFNGEIYNHLELRAELEAAGREFRSRSDTEVLLHAYDEWGAKCVERLNGMFAFVVWDRERREIFCARDRFGVKPLYWACNDEAFVAASEIKAILEHPAIERSICYEALDEYFTFQNVFSDLTLFEGVRLLPAGCTLTLRADEGEPRIQRYWDYVFGEPLHASEDEVAAELHRRFVQAVERQLVSDVPVGAYLSGGMDSGSIVAAAVQSLPRLTTFTGGFDISSAAGLELGFDERRAAEMMSNRLKTEHYEVVLHAGDMEWILPRLIWHLEDLRVGQCYPNYYVARLASKFVKVVLSGAGGDELFGGYPWRYYPGMEARDKEDYLRRYYTFWQRLVPDEEKASFFNDATLERLGRRSSFDVFRGVFDGYTGDFDTPEGRFNASLYFELKTFLHGLLVVEDKLSMAHSLETRVPFLDNDLVDYALRIPPKLKVRDPRGANKPVDENAAGKRVAFESATRDGKLILRRGMAPLVPPEIVERAKQGFSAPDASWFRGESIDYINRLLRDPDARIYRFVRPEYVGRVLDDHCSGRINRRLLIWSLLSFEWWLREYFP